MVARAEIDPPTRGFSECKVTKGPLLAESGYLCRLHLSAFPANQTG